MMNIVRLVRGTKPGWISASLVVGAVLAQLVVCWVGLCGTAPLSLAALTTGFAAGAILADWAGDRMRVRSTNGRWMNKSASVMTTALVALIWLSPQLLNATLLAGCETVGFGGSLSVMLTLLFPALIVAVVSAAAGLFFQSVNPDAGAAWMSSAIAGAPGALILMIHGWFSFPMAITVTAAIALSLVCRILADGSAAAAADSFDPTRAEAGPGLTFPAISLHFVGVGILTAAIAEIMTRLLPFSVPVLLLSVGLTAAGLLLCSTSAAVRWLTVGGLNAMAVLTLATLPFLFFMLADFNLWINTQISAPVTVIFLRSLQCAALATAATVPSVLAAMTGQRRAGAPMVALSVSAGLIPGLAFTARGVSPALVLAAGIACHAIAAFVAASFSAWEPRGVSIPVKLILRRSAMPVLLLLVSTLTFFSSIESTRVSSLLFSQRTRVAVERGVEKDLIAQSDANRLVTKVHGFQGEISVWRRAGHLIEFQRNGVSLGQVSTDTNLSPQPAEEILPAIMALVSHPQPARVLILGDDTGACLRTCSHFPVQEIVAIRSDQHLTELARRFTWSHQDIPADQDSRVRILHGPQVLALRDRTLNIFDAVIAASEPVTSASAAFQFTTEYYAAARSRMSKDSIFCQRFRQQNSGPDPIRQTMATMMEVFAHVGIVQTVPGEILVFATDQEKGLIDPQILSRLQRDHVQREIASAGWDWSQVATLPLIDANDPIGVFSNDRPPRAISISRGGFVMGMPLESARRADKAYEMRLAFAPHQMQILAAVPMNEDQEEVKRRLSAMTQQLEILAGMPDQPWTYRKSLRMEMQRSPRPPQEEVRDGRILKTSHPLDELRRDYFVSLGRALSAVGQSEPTAVSRIDELERYTGASEPLLTHFAHYEIVRLHEMAKHPSPEDEFRHRVHIVFFTSTSDASVRPVISAIEQLVTQPELVGDTAERYDLLNELVQKLIERWEARTAWEPRSALRVQNDVDQSVRVANLALKMMESMTAGVNVDAADFLRRRRYINAALISPLRDYRDQVLAHRLKTETPAEPGTEDPNDMPLLLNSGTILARPSTTGNGSL